MKHKKLFSSGDTLATIHFVFFVLYPNIYRVLKYLHLHSFTLKAIWGHG